MADSPLADDTDPSNSAAPTEVELHDDELRELLAFLGLAASGAWGVRLAADAAPLLAKLIAQLRLPVEEERARGQLVLLDPGTFLQPLPRPWGRRRRTTSRTAAKPKGRGG